MPAVDEVSLDEHAHAQFKQEVAETFLRCIKEHISHDNAVIELNGLKIAEDRTFADCARQELGCTTCGVCWLPHVLNPPLHQLCRYIFTTMLTLCLPAGPAVKPEFRELFQEEPIESTTKEGRLDMLRRVNAQLKAWKALLHRFLKCADDQVI